MDIEAILSVRNDLSRLRGNFYERQLIMADKGSSLQEIEGIQNTIQKEASYLRVKVSRERSTETILEQEWRTLPAAIVIETSIFINLVTQRIPHCQYVHDLCDPFFRYWHCPCVSFVVDQENECGRLYTLVTVDYQTEDSGIQKPHRRNAG